MKKLHLNLPLDRDLDDADVEAIVYTALDMAVGFHRPADLAVIRLLARNENLRGNAGASRLLEIVCEYAWDYMAGKPSEWSPDRLYHDVAGVLEDRVEKGEKL